MAKHRIPKREGERWRRLAALLQDSREIGRREVLLPVVPAAFHSHTRIQHAMWSSSCSRARFNRAHVRRALASLSTTAMMFLQRGGANPAGRPLSSMAWSRALRAADSASRISPLSFDGDKRGRMRQFCEAVAFDQKFLWSDVSLRLLADPVRFRWSESTTWCHDVVSVPNGCRSRQHASKSCGGSSR